MSHELPISVLTPSFNQAAFIRQTIESVREQDVEKVEHIVIDGGSTDGTVDILAQYPHLRWVSEPDRGQADALNKGLAMASGHIIVWINSDDLLAPGALAAAREFFQAHPDAHILCGNEIVIDAEGRLVRRAPPKTTRRTLTRPWHGQTGVFQPGMIFRRTVPETVGPFDPDLVFAMDYDFFLRASERFAIHPIRRDLGCFRVHGGTKTGEEFAPAFDEVAAVLLRHLRRTRPGRRPWWARLRLRLHRPAVLVGDALKAYEAGRPDRARRLLLHACLRNPFSLLAYGHFCYRLRQLVGPRFYERLRRRQP